MHDIEDLPLIDDTGDTFEEISDLDWIFRDLEEGISDDEEKIYYHDNSIGMNTSNPIKLENIANKTVFQILTEIVHSDLILEELIGLATPLINTIDIRNPVGREEKRSKAKLKLKLEKYRDLLIPTITSPSYQMKLQSMILSLRNKKFK